MQQGQLNRQYVSSIDFMNQREIMNKVLDLYDEETDIIDILEQTGRYVQSADTSFVYHVNTRLHAAATVSAIVAAPAAGAASVIPLTAGSVKPRVGDMMLSKGRNVSFVTVVSGNNITVKPVNSALLAHPALAANDQVTFFSNANAEGSGVAPGYIYNTLQYSNNIQIIKGDFSVTDLQGKTMVEVEFEGQYYYFIKGQKDAFNRFKMDVAYAHLLGEKSVGLTDADGKSILTTQGLEKTVRGGGIDLPLDTTSNATFQADFKEFGRALDQTRGPSEYWMWNGPDIDNFIDDWLMEKEGLKAGGIVYNSFGKGDAKKKSVDLGFDSFRVYGRTYHKKKMAALDNPELTAAAGFTYPSTSFFIPATKIKCNHDKEMKDRFRVRYIAAPGNSRIKQEAPSKYLEIVTGGLAQNPTNKEATLDITYNTWQGPEFLGVEHFGINSL